MSSYTMQLKTYIEMFSQDETLNVRDRIEKGRSKLFDFDYPIFDSAYKKVFETHFIRKFYMREIGFETEGLFKFQLESWMLINMPYFNKLFESELISYNPLQNTVLDVTNNKKGTKNQSDTRDVTQNSTTDGTSNSVAHQTSIGEGTKGNVGTGTTTDDNFDRALESTNPDSRLAITTNDGQGVIEYASNIKENNENNVRTHSSNVDETTTNNNTDDATNDTTANTSSETIGNDTLVSDINETQDYIEHRVGKTGTQTYAKMIQEHRESFLRIENRIFNEMQELFMLVY